MGDKSLRVNTTSKIRICEAALTGLLRRELRLVGYWLVANQSHQIEYHRQKIHSLKTRIGGDAALEELLQCVSALATTTDDRLNDQHGSKPAEKIANVSPEALISSDWMNAFNGASCTDNIAPQPEPLRKTQPPVHMDFVAQQLSTQLLTMHQPDPSSVRQIPSEFQDPATGPQNDNVAHNEFILMPDLYANSNFDQFVLHPQKSGGSSDTSFVTQSTCPEPPIYAVQPSQRTASSEQIRPENLELATQILEIDTSTRRSWTAESAIYAVERFRRSPLSKDHHDLLSYVLNLGDEMERKCIDVMESCRIWNTWAEEHLHLIPARTESTKTFTFRPQRVPEYAGWRIHLEDRPRQRYTKRTVQKWMTYMSSSSKGPWHSGITARNFREALDNGGLFCTIGAARQEDLAYNILGGRRNHVTRVEALNICCGQYEKEYEFKRYDTDLILPECMTKNPLPRVVVFECQELNLRAVMLIIRPSSGKGPVRRPAKRTKKFDTLLAGELPLDQIDRAFSATGPDISSSLPSSEMVPADDLHGVNTLELPCTTYDAGVEDTDPVEDAPIPRLKVEQLDESELYCSSRHVNNPGELPAEEVVDSSIVAEGVMQKSVSPLHWESQEVAVTLDAGNISSLAVDWQGEDVVWPSVAQPLTRPLDNCWFSESLTTELTGMPQLASHNAFENAIFAASATQQQVKRCRTSQVQY